MKKFIQLSLIILVLTFIMSACTMQKRVYMSGYNVEWKKGSPKNDNQGLAENKTKNEAKPKSESNVEPFEKTELAKTLIANNAEVNNGNLTASIDNSNLLASKNDILVSNNKSNYYTPIPIAINKPAKPLELIKSVGKIFFGKNKKNIISNENEFSGSALASFLCALLGVLFLILSASAPAAVTALAVLALISFLLAIILGVMAKHKMHNSHDEIKGKGLAVLGIILGWIGIVTATIFVIIGVSGGFSNLFGS